MSYSLLFVIISIVKSIVLISLVMVGVMIGVYLERRILGFIQLRYGPNRCGPFGILQSVADGIKLFFKQDITLPVTEKALYIAAPIIAGVTALFPFVAIPFADKVLPDTINLFGTVFDLTKYSLNRGVIADLPGGILFILSVSSLSVYGVLLAGWSSDNKYSFLGAMRIASQMLSYELFLGISIMGVIMITGSLRMTEIVEAQKHVWNVVYQPVGFILYMIAGFAEACRTPFDLIECENELGSGFNTEYSSMKFALFYLAEYIHIVTISSIAVTLFLGGWEGPWLPSGLWFIIKVFCLFVFFVWVRGTYPRVRFDQLMSVGWKYLFPVAMANLIATGVFVLIL